MPENTREALFFGGTGIFFDMYRFAVQVSLTDPLPDQA